MKSSDILGSLKPDSFTCQAFWLLLILELLEKIMSLPDSVPDGEIISVESHGEDYVSFLDDRSVSHVGRMQESNLLSLSKSDKPDKSRNPGASTTIDTRQECLANCSYKLSKSRYFKSAQRVKKYWQNVMLLYSSINDELRFPIFPEKTEELTHLSAQLWIATYGMQDVADDLAETVQIDALNELYLRTVYEGDLTGKSLEKFHAPLENLSKVGGNYIHHMKVTVGMLREGDSDPNGDADDSISVNTRTAVNLEAGSKILTIKKSLLSESRIHQEGLYHRLKIYTRTAVKRKWFSFNGLQRPQMMSIINDSLQIVADSFVKLRKLLPPVLTILTVGKSGILGKKFLTNLKDMASCLDKMSKNKECMNKDEIDILTELRRVEAYFQSIVKNGHKILRRLFEVIGMSILCYKYVTDSLGVSFKAWEEVCKSLTGTHTLDLADFQEDDFLKTRYPDILRKVPVVIRRVELSLHKQPEFRHRRSNSLRRRSTIGKDGFRV